MRRLPVLLLVCLSTVAPYSAGGGEAPSQPDRPPLKFGAILDGCVMSYVAKGTDHKWYCAELDARRVRPLVAMFPDRSDDMHFFDFGPPGFPGPLVPPDRWRVHRGCFWVTLSGERGKSYYYFPQLLRMGCSPRNSRQNHDRSSNLSRAHIVVPADDSPAGGKSRGSGDVMTDSGALEKNPESLQLVSCLQPLRIATAFAIRCRGYHDILPLSPQRVLLFLLATERIMVWRYDFHAARHEQGHLYWRGEWRRLATFHVEFSDRFHVAYKRGAYFFITDSGAVYHTEAVAEGRWKTRTLWDDPSRPILAMLVDADQPRSFAFGKDFYFELDHKIEPKPCEDITDGPAELGDPMRTVLECGKVLHKAGLLKDTQRTGATP
jgi:hypothetical protein